MTALVALLLGSATTACADVVADSIVVELSRDDNNKYNSNSKKKDGISSNGDHNHNHNHNHDDDDDDDDQDDDGDEQQHTAGGLQSLCWASAAVGGIFSAYFSGSLVSDYGPRPVFLMTAVFPLLVSVAALAIPEQPIRTNYSGVGSIPPSTSTTSSTGHTFLPEWDHMADSVTSQGKALWGALSQKAILYPALFVFLWQATPTADTAMLFFETNKLNFSTEFLGHIRLVAALSSLVGVGVYNFYLKKTPLKKMFFWSAILGTLLGSTQLLLVTRTNKALGLGDGAFALADSALLTVLGQVSFMPVLVLAARLCPEGVEATLFATLMSILNGGAFLGSALGSVLTGMFGVTADDYSNLAPLVLVCTLMTLAPLPLLRFVPDDDDDDDDSGRRKKFDDDVEK
jgi:folate/biopterin transporter